MTFHLYKIKFLTGVHLGSKSGVEPILHSDTLFSILYSESEELGRKLDKDKILLSSAFPYYEDSLYLPKPFIPL
jgi:CRISPR/Cas system CSM-associated protein Csm4 (group 5 of RAMP superfamily)